MGDGESEAAQFAPPVAEDGGTSAHGGQRDLAGTTRLIEECPRQARRRRFLEIQCPVMESA